jgi:hypothetical protein
VRLQDLARDREPEPRALAGRLRSEEPVEDLRLHVDWNPRPIIGDLDLDELPAASGADRQVPTLAGRVHGLARVVQEVHQNLSETVRVGRHAGQIGLEVSDELDPGHGALGPLEVHRLLDERVQVDRLECGRPRLGHRQELAHEALGPLGGLDDLAGPVAAGRVGPRIRLDHLRERHQRREGRVDVVNQPRHVLPDRREPLDLHQMRARLADLLLERPHYGGAVLARQRDAYLACQALEHAELLGGQIERGIVPRQRQETARAGLAGANGKEKPRRGSVAEPGRCARESKARDPGGLAALEKPGQLVGQVKRGALERVLVERARGPARDRLQGDALGRGREEGQRLTGPERGRQARHDVTKRPGRLGARLERVDDGQERLHRAGARLGALEETRLVDRERRRAGEQAQDGEIARGEAGAVREPVGVEHAHDAAADLERHRHGRLDAPALRHKIREPREIVALAQQDRAAGLSDPARYAFAQTGSLLPCFGLAGRGPRRRRHAELVSLDEHQGGLVRAQRVGRAVHDMAEQLVGRDLVGEEIER